MRSPSGWRRWAYDVVIGSRDAERAAELAAVYGAEGKANADAVQGVDLVVLATKSNASAGHRPRPRRRDRETPVLCVASDLRFGDNGVLPGRSGTSLAEEVAEILSAPVAAGLQTLAAAHLTQRDPPDEDALICGDDERPSCSRSSSPTGSSRGVRSTPARSPTPARSRA